MRTFRSFVTSDLSPRPRPSAPHSARRRRDARVVTSAATLLALGALFTSGLGCSHDSYLLLTLLSADSPFTNIGFVEVDVMGSGGMTTLSYTARTPIDFDTTGGKTLSIGFTPSRSGMVDLMVRVFDAADAGHTCALGSATLNAAIKKGEVAKVSVKVQHVPAESCDGTPDGGAPDTGDTSDGGGPDGATFPGCDPAAPQTCPTAGQTCFVNCQTSMGMCIPGGTRGPGETCAANNDCMPGTQCFDYSGIEGCAAGTKVCLKFCANDTMCAGVGATPADGGAPLVPAACRNPVACGPTLDQLSHVHVRLRSARRRDARLSDRLVLLPVLRPGRWPGATGLQLQGIVPDRRGRRRLHHSKNCAPGLICNEMSGTRKCRKLCRMGSTGECSGSQGCMNLINNDVFGVCI